MIRRDRTKNVVCLIDMDCFYCQVEEKLNPALQGRPVAVVQYNAWQGGGIIAVNYAARARGVTRHMRGDEAKKHCPEIELVRVPNVRQKADLTKYRDAGKEVAVVLQKNTALLERASVDEAYLDITERVDERLKEISSGNYSLDEEKLFSTFAVGFDDISTFLKTTRDVEDSIDEAIEEEDALGDSLDEEKRTSNLRLLIGATIVNEIRAQVKAETGYECSAGIAHNKILAKLACGINKPNKQTVLPLREIPKLFETLAINKIRGLGGKFGEIVCDSLGVKFMGDLLRFSERELQAKFDEKNGSWLYLMCRGIDLEPVTPKYVSKSIGCCKKFPGKAALFTLERLSHWLGELATEIHDRLEKDMEENNRRANLLTVSYMQSLSGEDISSSRSINLESYESKRIASDALECIKRNTDQFLCTKNPENLHNAVKFLGLSVGKFEKMPSNRNRLQEMFKQVKEKAKVESGEKKEVVVEEKKKPEVKKEEEPKEVKPPKLTFFQRFNLKVQEEEKKRKEEMEQKPPVKTETHEELLDDLITEMETQEEEVKEEEEVEEESERVKEESVDLGNYSIEGEAETSAILFDDPPAKQETTNYTTEYAEYYAQNLNLEQFMKICPRCNVKVPNYDYDSHQDFHFAMDVSQQQRMEFRSSIQTQKKEKVASSPKPSTSGTKRSQKPAATVTSSQILKYLKKEPEESQEPLPDTEMCPDCGKFIPVDQVREHSDFHVAKKLQLELQMQDKVAVVTKTSSPVLAKRRKTPGGGGGKSIATFFSNPT